MRQGIGTRADADDRCDPGSNSIEIIDLDKK